LIRIQPDGGGGSARFALSSTAVIAARSAAVKSRKPLPHSPSACAVEGSKAANIERARTCFHGAIDIPTPKILNVLQPINASEAPELGQTGTKVLGCLQQISKLTPVNGPLEDGIAATGRPRWVAQS
jgi:hypothetical protein